MFVRNVWYMAAWAGEIGRERLLSRTLLGERVVFYCTEAGDPVALADRCPHRFVPLHVGELKGDVLQCGYHGLRFDRAGACVMNPHGDGQISRNMQVKSFPVVDQDGIVWIWMGDPALADPSKIHRFPFIADRRRYTPVFGRMDVAANYQLINDNLLDLSHVQYVHPIFRNPDGQGAPRNRVADSGQEGDTLWERATTSDSPTIPFAAMFHDLPRVDSFNNTYWHGPSIVYLDIGTGPVGEARGPETSETPSVHLLTPQTETSTHYFWTLVRNRRLDDEALSQTIWNAINQAFAIEDKPIIEMQQAKLGARDLLAMKPVLLQTDSKAMRARRMVQAMLEAEQEPARAARVAEPAA